MCREATNCKLTARVEELGTEMSDFKRRLERVEGDMGKMRSETAEGFRRGAVAMQNIDTSIINLAHEFGSRMNTLEQKIADEKQRWGETLRWSLKVVVRVLSALALAAGGITICGMFFTK